jgi:hypothetical protein
MFKRAIFYILFFLCIAVYSFAQNKMQLTDFDLTKSYQKFGIATKHALATGEKLDGNENLIGIIPPSIMRILLDSEGSSSYFKAEVGVTKSKIDFTANDISSIPLGQQGQIMLYREGRFIGVAEGDRSVGEGSVVFKVLGDGKELFNSGIMRPDDPVKMIHVSLEGIENLELVVEDGGDGAVGDYGFWSNTELVTYKVIKPFMNEAFDINANQDFSNSHELELNRKIAALEEMDYPLKQAENDWLIDNSLAKANVYRSTNSKDIIITNGLLARIFRVLPNLATINIINQMNTESLLRAVSPEGSLTIDGKRYSLGGLVGQKEFGYLMYDWVDQMQFIPGSFVVEDFIISDLPERINWARTRWASNYLAPAGKVITFSLRGQNELSGVVVNMHYAIYDGIPTISKWFDIINRGSKEINLDHFKLEELAIVDHYSPLGDPKIWELPNIHIESDWGFNGMTHNEAEKTVFWEKDTRYQTQRNWNRNTPCLLEVKLPMGPDVTLAPDEIFTSFRVWEMPFDSYEKERKGFFIKQMYRTISPWVTENPILMHCVSSDENEIKTAIDQCAETGYEMVILSFGSGLNMEDESDGNYKKYRSLTEYAKTKGIELGGYSLLSSRWISDEVDVINPETGSRGGMIFGSAPCLASEWGHDYFRKIKTFYEKTGMTVFENDGSYPGDVCASSRHKYHKGLEDSQWEQRKTIAGLYQWMNQRGIYMNIPDYYFHSGGNKTCIGYFDQNYSLPLERQIILGRQLNYDGLWDRTPSMCWSFVPLTMYHGGGNAATIEPFHENLDHYQAHMMLNYGFGIQACYRGKRLFDTEETKNLVKEMIDWYKEYRIILNSDIVHIRRPDGMDYDAILHVNPKLKIKGMLIVYNPLNEEITRYIKVNLYYTGLKRIARISEQERNTRKFKLDNNFNVNIPVTIPAKGTTWLTIKD